MPSSKIYAQWFCLLNTEIAVSFQPLIDTIFLLLDLYKKGDIVFVSFLCSWCPFPNSGIMSLGILSICGTSFALGKRRYTKCEYFFWTSKPTFGVYYPKKIILIYNMVMHLKSEQYCYSYCYKVLYSWNRFCGPLIQNDFQANLTSQMR